MTWSNPELKEITKAVKDFSTNSTKLSKIMIGLAGIMVGIGVLQLIIIGIQIFMAIK